MATVTQTRVNRITNPLPGSTTGFASSGGAGAWTYNTSEAEPFARFTKDATLATTALYYGSAITAPIGTTVSFRYWVRSSSGGTITLRNNGTAFTINATRVLVANTWTEVIYDAHVTTIADFRPAFVMTSMAANSTWDLKEGIVEFETTCPGWFYGYSPDVTDESYSPAATWSYDWTGTVNASTSTATLSVPLQDYQIELPDGTIVGAGTPVGLLQIDGLRGVGEPRSSDTDRSGVDGMSPGQSLLTGRRVGIKWLITDPAGAEPQIQKLVRNWQNIIDPASVTMTARDYMVEAATAGVRKTSALRIQLPGRPVPFLLFGKPGPLSPPVDSSYQHGWVEIESEWIDLDGRVYDEGRNTAMASLPTSTGGAAFPWTFPVNFGPSTGGTVQVANDGLYPAKPVFQITGPITNPSVIDSASGKFVKVNLALASGDTLIIDTDSRVVRLNGVNRNNALDTNSSFFTIPPGGTSLSFSSTDVAGSVFGALFAYTLNTYSAA